jgi:hypothetical protein
VGTFEVTDRREVFPIMVPRNFDCAQDSMLGSENGPLRMSLTRRRSVVVGRTYPREDVRSSPDLRGLCPVSSDVSLCCQQGKEALRKRGPKWRRSLRDPNRRTTRSRRPSRVVSLSRRVVHNGQRQRVPDVRHRFLGQKVSWTAQGGKNVDEPCWRMHCKWTSKPRSSSTKGS